jgi:hypothetical protein
MIDLKNNDYYKNLMNNLYLRLSFSVGASIFIAYKAFNKSYFDSDLLFLNVFTCVSNLFVAIMFLITFKYANNRKDTYLQGDLKQRLMKYLEATMYRHSTFEISPVFFMIGFMTFGKIYFLIEAICCYLIFGLYFPTAKRLTNNLDLNNINNN